MTDASRCPLCGRPLPADGPAGVCPACVLRLGLETNATGAARGKAPEPAALAASFPQLEILELVGQGGMGIVYKARQRSLDRLVALKILPLDTAGDPAFEERFVRESRTLAQLTHPNIVTVFDSGKAGGFFFLVMEYVDGVNLRKAIATRALTPADALEVVRQVCDALQHAHDAGVVHRDIKPENILLDGRGRVQIADFGLAKLLGRTPVDISLTATQQILGTFRYMAPEQMERPMSVDHRADIYSLGVVLYELLTGELPLGRFALPSERGTDAGLDKVVLRALERDPARRYQRASELKTDVTSVSSEEATPTPAAPTAPVMTVQFWAPASLIANSTSQGFVELYDDRVAFDFEVVSTWGSRTLRAVRIPLDRVRSVEFTQSWVKGKFVQMRVDDGPWTVQLPFTWEGEVWFAVGSKEEGEGFVAAMHERIGSPQEGTRMLTTIPKAFSWTFTVMDGSQPVAQAVDLSWGYDKGELTVQGTTYTARREGVMSGEFVLESTAGVVARATKPGALRRSLIVEHAGRQYTLRATSALQREFVLLDGSTRIGSVSPEGFFTRRAAADLPSTLPLTLRVFIIWLTVMQWKFGDGS